MLRRKDRASGGAAMLADRLRRRMGRWSTADEAETVLDEHFAAPVLAPREDLVGEEWRNETKRQTLDEFGRHRGSAR